MNIASARVKTLRAPNRSAIQPLAGINTARVDEICADPDIEIHRLHAKAFRHIGQRGGDHRAIEKLHKERARD
ncbi:Uncharacterised protein [Leclercia adecarboxylata]|uniref:Uncharacterized protein n=1 Tax=Leclercia adecarboxylata TaxID=83655 RepID=A0A4V6JIY3_9ENTR|nr:Uncharacterised protein [Leclercia adecarboxylata]